MEYTFFLVLSPITMGMVIITFLSLWKYRDDVVGRALILYFSMALSLILANVFELIAHSDYWTLIWAMTGFVIYSALPLSWLWFAFSFAEVKFSRPRLLWVALSIVPVISLILALTIRHHGFIYASVKYFNIRGYSTVDPEYGMWFWLNGAYHYTLLIFGALLTARYIFFSGEVHRGRAVWILAGIATPLLVNFLYILPLPIFQHKDYTPIAFGITGLLFFIGIYWQRMLQIVPQARNLVFDNMDQAVLILDGEFSLVDYNQAAADILTLHPSDLGRSASAVDALSNIVGSHRLDVSSAFEMELESAGGSRNLDVFVRPISSGSEQFMGYLILISDTTVRMSLMVERMQLLADMQEANDELRKTQLRLIHREKLASIGQLSAGLAHELKNPISYLQSNFRVLRKRLLDLDRRYESLVPDWNISSVRSILTDSEAGFERILAVVDNLLQFSRPGRSQTKEMYDLNDGIESTLRITRELMAKERIVHVRKSYGEIPRFPAFSSEINQVILNLLTNAIHAVGHLLDEDPLITITTYREDDRIGCEICNNGIPIEAEIREKIFEPFFSTKESGLGTGLGLSIARDIIVERHGGSIDVTSDREKTCFRLTLPLHLEEREF